MLPPPSTPLNTLLPSPPTHFDRMQLTLASRIAPHALRCVLFACAAERELHGRPCSPAIPAAGGVLVRYAYDGGSLLQGRLCTLTPADAESATGAELLRVLQCCSIRMYRKELNFMVTENLFYHKGAVVKPDATYDIKGSWVDRNARGTRTHKPEGGTFKDQDLNSLIYLPTAYRNKLLLTLQRQAQNAPGLTHACNRWGRLLTAVGCAQ